MYSVATIRYKSSPRSLFTLHRSTGEAVVRLTWETGMVSGDPELSLVEEIRRLWRKSFLGRHGGLKDS